MNKRNVLTLLTLLTSLFVFNGCENKISDELIDESFLKQKETKWFLDKKNIYDSLYINKSIIYFKKLDEDGQKQEAYEIAGIVSENLISEKKNDSLFYDFLKNKIELRENNISTRNKLKIISYLGVFEQNNENIQESIKTFDKINDIEAITNEEKKLLAASLSHQVRNQISSLQLDDAIANNLKASSLYNEIKDSIGIVNCLTFRSKIYLELSKYDESLKIIDNVIKFHETKKNYNSTLEAFLDKIDIYQSKQDSTYFDLIKITYSRFKNSQKIDLETMLRLKMYYAQKLILLNKYHEAIEILDEEKSNILKVNKKGSTTFYTLLLSRCDIEMNNELSNNVFYINLLKQFEENKDYYGIINIYYLFIQEAINKNDYKKAYEILSKSKKLSDDVITKEIRNKSVELETVYKTKMIEDQVVVKEKKLNQQNKTIIILTFSLISILFLSIISYLVNKQRKAKKEKERKVFLTNQLLINSEYERKRIANNLHDSISHELLELKSLYLNNKGNITLKIDGIINNVRRISRNLHPLMFEKTGFKAAVEDLVENFQIQQNIFISSEINYKKSLETNKELQIYRIIQEVLNNIIKHSNAKAVKINIYETESFLIIEIKDNGVGFNLEEKLKSNKSFGIHSIIERASIINSIITIDSNSSGTTIILKVII